VKKTASFLLTISLVALSVTFSALLAKPVSVTQNLSIPTEKVEAQGLVFSCATGSLGFEDFTRSYQSIISPFSKTQDVHDFELVEKFQTIVTKVSYKYLYALQFFQTREEYLFLDLRKLLI
jgi:hypothetical protein